MTVMNIFKRGRSRSPASFEVPKLCLSRQRRTLSVESGEGSVETLSVRYTGTPPNTPSTPSRTPHHHQQQQQEKQQVEQVPPKSPKAPRSPKNVPKSPKGKTKIVKQKNVIAAPSLEVPDANPRIRSSSFDTSSFEHERVGDDDEDNMLQVPSTNRRSRSFDATYNGGSTSDEGASSDRETSGYSSFLSIPKYYRRRSMEIPKICIHCVHMEALSEMGSSQETSPTSPGGSRFDLNKCGVAKDYWSSDSDTDDITDDDSFGSNERFIPITLSVTPTDSEEAIVISSTMVGNSCGDTIPTPHLNTTTLEVPHVKPRSASMDASYLQPGVFDDRRASLDVDMLDIPKQPRSSSVEVSLPTEESSHYKAITSPSTASER